MLKVVKATVRRIQNYGLLILFIFAITLNTGEVHIAHYRPIICVTHPK